MMRFFLVLCALYAGSAVAAAAPPSSAQDAAPVHQERNLSERAGAVMGRAAEETTSAFGRALQWTGRQLEGAGQWTARQGETIGTERPATAPAPVPVR